MKPRRWFSFSLRTFFILLTLFGVWLGVQMKWIRDRREAIQVGRVSTTSAAPVKAPWQIRLLGARGYRDILVFPKNVVRPAYAPPRCSEQEARRLFPEAKLYQANRTGWIPP